MVCLGAKIRAHFLLSRIDFNIASLLKYFWLNLWANHVYFLADFLVDLLSDFLAELWALFLSRELVLLGGLFVISLYMGFFFRITRLVTKSTKAFGAMVVTGLGFSFVFQAFINIAVATHLVPVTGVTLPMISLGGTSIIMNCISLGIILSVSKFVESSNIGTDVATNK